MTFPTLLLILELAASLAYVGSKYLLSKKDQRGWLVAAGAALLTGLMFYQYKRDILFIQELGNFVLACYGYSSWTIQHKRLGLFRAFTLSLTFLICLGSLLYTTSFIGLVELLVVISYYLGTVFLAYRRQSGWALYLIAHVLTMYVTLLSGAYAFSLFQLVSAFIALSALIRKK